MRKPRSLPCFFVLGWFVSFGLVPGCVTTSPPTEPKPSRTDRFAKIYPELSGGRFLIVADFEDEKHVDLFRVETASGAADCALDAGSGRAETGRGALHCKAVATEDELLMANTESSRWYLVRDWRPFDLLLFSMHAPRGGLSLDVTIASGSQENRASARTTLPLVKGWNALRLDLADVAELVALDDVQELRWSVRGSESALKLSLDDIVLTSNRQDVFGDSRNAVGGLYTQRAGRRWNIGAGGKFELTFVNGQITAWYNLESDPHRVRNLVQGTTLGPAPVALSEDGTELGDFSAWGRSVAARQRLVEANRVRIVVSGDWHFVDSLDQPTDGRPFQRWTYTIYASGAMFVEVEAAARTSEWSPPKLGLAVSVASAAPDEWTIAGGQGALARSTSTGASLVYAVFGAGATPTTIADPRAKRVSLIQAIKSDAPIARWIALVALGSMESLSGAHAESVPAAFLDPQPIRLEVGRASGGPSNGREVRLNPATGVHKIEAEHGQARFTLEPNTQGGPACVFEVQGVGRDTCWVYVDHLVLEEVARLPDGNLLFQVPHPKARPLPVEVLCNRVVTP